MKKLTFSEKNHAVITHQHADHFDNDLKLFRQHCPGSRLNNDLSRANIFTKSRLDGLMILALLEIISLEEILEHREKCNAPAEDFSYSEEAAALEVARQASEAAALEATKQAEDAAALEATKSGEEKTVDAPAPAEVVNAASVTDVPAETTTEETNVDPDDKKKGQNK